MPLIPADQSQQRPAWGIAVLVVAAVTLVLGTFATRVWRSTEPTVLGSIAITGPRCWVEEPVPYIYVSGREPGKMDEFEVRFRIGEIGFYTRKD
jgi:hypothetical protein